MNRRLLSVITEGCNQFFMDDEEEDHNHVPKVTNFTEEIVPQFNDKQFKSNFRMEPKTFEDFLQKLHSIKNHSVAAGHPELPLEKQAMITVWYLANMESFRSVSGRFGISTSTCWSVLTRTCHKILDVNRQFEIIHWPSRQRALETMAAFERISGFPGVTGCIDGSHIKILPPKEHPNSYFNRKKFHSVLLQGICDE